MLHSSRGVDEHSLSQAGFIKTIAVPALARYESLLIHTKTILGKILADLLPLTKTMYGERFRNANGEVMDVLADNDGGGGW